MDNQSALRLIHNPEFQKRLKRLKVRYFFLRDVDVRGDIVVRNVSTEQQRADMFTLALSKNMLFRFRAELSKHTLNDTNIN